METAEEKKSQKNYLSEPKVLDILGACNKDITNGSRKIALITTKRLTDTVVNYKGTDLSIMWAIFR
jgi:hypothetical protein